jgi:hypothetical protein
LRGDIELDHLSDDEVSQCCQVGSVLRPNSPRFPVIIAGDAVGIRHARPVLKVIRGEDETHETIDASTEGTVGDRPPLRGDLIVDDVVSACG